MRLRDEAKKSAILSSFESDWQIYRKLRNYVTAADIEVIWLQINLPHIKPLLIGCVYRPPSANVDYLNQMCLMLDQVCDLGHETYLLGDTNIDWNSSNCPLKARVGNFFTVIFGKTVLIASQLYVGEVL